MERKYISYKNLNKVLGTKFFFCAFIVADHTQREIDNGEIEIIPEAIQTDFGYTTMIEKVGRNKFILIRLKDGEKMPDTTKIKRVTHAKLCTRIRNICKAINADSLVAFK